MNEIATLTFRLETFLVQLDAMNRRWAEWLSSMETAVVGVNTEQLNTISAAAAKLMNDLQEILADRQSLLVDAEAHGLAAPDLRTLASRLPAWSKPSLRSAIAVARSQIGNLKRMHFATWVLTNQMLEHYGDVMRLLGRGTLRQNVYIPSQDYESEGGQLLDTTS